MMIISKIFNKKKYSNTLYLAYIIFILSYSIFLFFFFSSTLEGLKYANNLTVMVVNLLTFLILVYTAINTGYLEKKYHYVWIFLAISQLFWVLGDLMWINYDSFSRDSFVNWMYLAYSFRTFFLCLSLYLIPKRKINRDTHYKITIEILMVLVLAFMILWSLIWPLITSHALDAASTWVLVPQILLNFVLVFFIISTIIYSAGYFKRIPVSLIVISGIIQLVTTIAFGCFTVLNMYRGGILDLGWVTASIFLVVAAVYQVDKKVSGTVTAPDWPYNVPSVNYLISALTVLGLILILWGYILNKSLFTAFLIGGGVLVLLSMFRQFVTFKLFETNWKKLRSSEQKYRDLFKTMAQGVVYQDTDGHIISANHAAQKILGFTLDEITFTDPSWKTVNDVSDFRAEEHPSMVALKTGKIVKNVIRRAYNPEKEKYVWIKINAIPKFRSGENKPYEVHCIFEDITELINSKEQIRKSLEEKEILIKEIHHRIKNNLQIVSSLINLQSMKAESYEAATALDESENRIRAIALIHEKLYKSENLAHIRLRDYIQDLASSIFRFYGVNPHRIQKKLDVDNLKIDIDSAVTLGLILNELISNSLKYAFPNGEGEIRIELKIKHNQYILTVADNGIGLPKNFNLDQVQTLGIQLVIRLVNQLEGTISVENFTGTRWRITFPNKYD